MQIIERIEIKRNNETKDLLIVKQQLKTRIDKSNYYIALLVDVNTTPKRINDKSVIEVTRQRVKYTKYTTFVEAILFHLLSYKVNCDIAQKESLQLTESQEIDLLTEMSEAFDTFLKHQKEEEEK